MRRSLAFLMTVTLAQADEGPSVRLGREVYIAEGCINCHSQYVRPVPGDIGRWGPAREPALALTGTPPLIGNRRQGPDLQNIAARRPRPWNRLHLLAPGDITPGSRMPSYRHLFTPGDGRGEALLDYLDSLGDDVRGERWQAAQEWRPAEDTPVMAHGETARRFVQWCAPCHGPGGRGDGPLAPKLAVPPRDLTQGPWKFVFARQPEAERLALARIIKFGVPGTMMVGREYLPDGEVLALAEWVRDLRR